MLERLFSTHQVADLLGAGESAVVEWVEKGWLPSKSMPGEPVRITERGLIKFLKDRGIDMEAIMAKISMNEQEKALSESELSDALQSSPDGESGSDTAVEEALPAEAPAPPSDAVEDAGTEPVRPANPAAQVVEAMLRDAIVKRVTHIHLDSCREGLALRVRIDGVLHDRSNFKSRLPKGLGPQLVAHFKSLAGLNADETARPQVGQFRLTVEGREVEFRLAICPAVHGEKIVVHVLDRAEAALALSELGLMETDLSLLRRLLVEPCGVILVAGLPGSGRATTLRAMLAEVDSAGRDLIALEKHGEVLVEGVNRCRANTDDGFTSAEAMRAFRDQDADVIMAEDITDGAALAAAVEAALDGRLVLASLFARTPAAALEMMLESARRWELTSVLLAVVVQRTVRKICPKCKREAEPSDGLLKKLGLSPEMIDFPVYQGRGCDECSKTGYAGRTGVFSLLHVDGAVAALLRNGADAGQIELAAVRAEMKTLQQARLEMVRAGTTSLEELGRVFPAAI